MAIFCPHTVGQIDELAKQMQVKKTNVPHDAKKVQEELRTRDVADIPTVRIKDLLAFLKEDEATRHGLERNSSKLLTDFINCLV
mmetsp:Transcript_19384/g.44161  ORF Transcript_19384/g.44161 Transcript_19384/m.44161 type:complete len:84 (+) Transcript_19384:348-599(+)